MNDADKIQRGLYIINDVEWRPKLSIGENRISVTLTEKLYDCDCARMKQLGWEYDEKTLTYTYEVKGER